MADYGWRQARSVEEALFQESHLFTFLQAVRLLEQTRSGETPGTAVDASREVVRFAHEVRFDFAAEDVTAIEESNGQLTMRTNVLGLAGANGPLPDSVTETLFRLPARDDAFHDFLDIFNHRLISLLFRARAKYRPALDRNAPEEGRVTSALFALLGLGTPYLRERMNGLRDRSLVAYCGLIGTTTRSETGLVRIIEDLFDVAAEVVQFRGRRYAIEADDVTRLGTRRGQNQRLGRGAILGTHIWDQAAAFDLCLGPLTLLQFRSFLPDGSAFQALLAAVRFYIQPELEFNVQLSLRAHEVPELRLGREAQPRLGWTSWLITRPHSRDDSQVRLKGGP